MTLNYEDHPDYERLPAAIRLLYTPKEYAWLPDDKKATLTTDECMPEWMEDD